MDVNLTVNKWFEFRVVSKEWNVVWFKWQAKRIILVMLWSLSMAHGLSECER